MADVTVDEIKAVLTAEIGNLTAEMNRAASAIEAMASSAQNSLAKASGGFTKFEAGVVSTEAALELARKAFELFKSGVELAADAVTESLAASNAYEDAVNGLNAALAASGQYSKQYSDSLLQLADSLQKTTTFGDEVIISVEKQLSTFRATSDQIKPLTEAVLDFATGMGIDATTAATQFGRVLDGGATSLGRMQLGISENASKLERYNALLQASARYQGQAAAAAETFGGQVKQISNLFDDFLKAIGDGIKASGSLQAALQTVKETMDDLAGAATGNRNGIRSLTDLVVDNLVPALISAAEVVADLVEGFIRLSHAIPGVDIFLNIIQLAGRFRSESSGVSVELEKMRARFEELSQKNQFKEALEDQISGLGSLEEKITAVQARLSDFEAAGVPKENPAVQAATEELRGLQRELDRTTKKPPVDIRVNSDAVKALQELQQKLRDLDTEGAAIGLNDIDAAALKLQNDFEKAGEKLDSQGHRILSVGQVSEIAAQGVAKLRENMEKAAAVDFQKALRASSIEELTAGLRGLDAQVEKTRLTALFDQLDKGVPFQIASERADLLAESLKRVNAAAGSIEIGDKFRDIDRAIRDAQPGLTDLDLAINKVGDDFADIKEKTGATVDAYGRGIDEMKAKVRELDEAHKAAASNLVDAFSKGIADVTAGILQGTRKWSDLLGAFRDIGVSEMTRMFTETIKNKIGILDSGFRSNLLTDIPQMFTSMAGNVLKITGALFDTILGQKGAFDSALGGIFNALGLGNVGQALGIGQAAVGAAGGGGGGGGTGIATGLLSLLGLGGGVTAATVAAPLVESQLGGLAPALLEELASAGAIVTPTGAVVVPEVTSQLSSIAATPALTSGGTAAGSTVNGATFLSSGQIYALLPAIAAIVGSELSKSNSPQLRATGAGLTTAAAPISERDIRNPFTTGGIQRFFQTLTLGGPGGLALANAIGFNPFQPLLSSGQTSRRAIGGLLGEQPALSGLLPKDVLDPYTTGLTTIDKAAQRFPEVFASAGNAVKAFGTALSLSVKSGQNDAKEFNYIVETLISGFGKAGTTGPDAIARTAAAMKELGLTADQAGQAITQAFQAGKISQQQFQEAMQGLGQIAQVSTKQMTDALAKGLDKAGQDTFNRLVKAGADSFQAVEAASSDAFQKIAAGLEDGLLPNAVAVFELLRSIGVSSAEAIADAFAGLSELGSSFPGGNSGSPQFFQHGGKLVFGSFVNGQFTPAAAPETTPQQQKDFRGTVPSFDIGGIVPGPIGSPTIAIVHGGETVVPTHTPAGLGSFAELLRGAGGGRVDPETIARAVARAVAEVPPRVDLQPVAFEDQVFSRLYRGFRESRFILPQTAPDKPFGVR